MFAVRDRRTGKFLKNFSGSYNHAKSHMHYKLCKYVKLPLREGETWARYESTYTPSREEVHAALFCLDSPDGAKLYTGNAGVQNSIGGGYRESTNANGHRCWEPIPLAEGKPWLEIVDVQTFERRRAAARKGAATRRSKGRKSRRAGLTRRKCRV